MKTKMGRPKLPKGTAKGVQVGVRFTPRENELIDAAIAKSGFVRDKAEWIRETAVSNALAWESKDRLGMDLIWGDIPYPLEELHRKTIEFKLMIKWDHLDAPALSTGTGRIFVRELKGKFHVQIISELSLKTEKIIDLTPRQAALIKHQPDGSKFNFSIQALQF